MAGTISKSKNLINLIFHLVNIMLQYWSKEIEINHNNKNVKYGSINLEEFMIRYVIILQRISRKEG